MFYSLTLKEIDLLIVVLILLVSAFLSTKISFTLLLISELFWITFYFMAILTAMLSDNVTFLALSLFCLIFSSVEISVGLTLINHSFKYSKSFEA